MSKIDEEDYRIIEYINLIIFYMKVNVFRLKFIIWRNIDETFF